MRSSTRAIALACAAAVVLSIAGCGESNDDASTADATADTAMADEGDGAVDTAASAPAWDVCHLLDADTLNVAGFVAPDNATRESQSAAGNKVSVCTLRWQSNASGTERWTTIATAVSMPHGSADAADAEYRRLIGQQTEAAGDRAAELLQPVQGVGSAATWNTLTHALTVVADQRVVTFVVNSGEEHDVDLHSAMIVASRILPQLDAASD